VWGWVQSTTLLWVHLLNGVFLRLARWLGRALRLPPLASTLAASLVSLSACHGAESLPMLLLVLAHFAACEALRRATLHRPGRYVPAVWLVSVAGIVLANAAERFRLPFTNPFEHLPRGMLGRSSFSGVHTFRYSALRMLSYGLDRSPAARAAAEGGGRSDARPNALAQYLAYVTYSPLRISGPIVTFDTFCATEAGGGAPRSAAASSAASLAAWGDIGEVFLWLLVTDVAMHTFYYPSVFFFFRGGTSRLLYDTFQPWEWWIYTLCYLATLFVQSHVVFRLPRAVAALDGVAAPDDTPQFFTRSSSSFRNHWLVFHQSLTLFFLRYIYLPGGGGYRCVWATVAFATLIHGFYMQWLVWGLLHVTTLTAEYWLARSFLWYRRPRLVVKAANQTLVLYSMVALALHR
jgi:D-alanyl-lipoteichoic acid acyltransferase DltB (MBOAT superfamily)